MILKSIGFRLESLDFNEEKFNGVKSNAYVNSDTSNNIPMAKTPSPPSANASNYLSVEIACSKSKIVSRLSFKFGESDDGATNGVKSSCTCPNKDATKYNNSFWEIQSTGTFVNPRRSFSGPTKVSLKTNCFL